MSDEHCEWCSSARKVRFSRPGYERFSCYEHAVKTARLVSLDSPLPYEVHAAAEGRVLANGYAAELISWVARPVAVDDAHLEAIRARVMNGHVKACVCVDCEDARHDAPYLLSVIDSLRRGTR